LSAFFSGAETALTAARRIKLEVWIRQKVKGAALALEYCQHPDQFLITTLIGNNLVMVIASSLFALYLKSYLNGFAITALGSLIILTFGEIIPKTLASDRPTDFSIRAAPIIRIFYFILYPLILLARIFTRLLIRFTGLQDNLTSRVFSREEMVRLLHEGKHTGVVDEDEHDLISRFILRGSYKLSDVMIHRTEIEAVPKDLNISELRNIFNKTGYSRLPVTGENIDNILGVVLARDVLIEDPKSISDVLRPVHFVPELKQMASFLNEMQTDSIGMAIVVDEYGGTAGLITLEDLIEEFFGDIQDEFDGEASLYRKIGPSQIDVNARVDIDELNERFQLHFPEGDYNTLGGFMMFKMGHIPRRGEKLNLETCAISVISGTRRTVKWVRIIKKTKKES